MTSTQIIQAVLLLLLAGVLIRRMWRRRMIKHYSVKELKEQLAQGAKPLLLDVRTTGEYRSGSIPGSVHLPLQELAARVRELEQFRGKEIICYCQSGGRSLSAAAFLTKNGFAAVNLRGGIAAWNYLRLP